MDSLHNFQLYYNLYIFFSIKTKRNKIREVKLFVTLNSNFILIKKISWKLSFGFSYTIIYN